MSELALTLIAEAKRTNSKVLDLGNCRLTGLQDKLFELIQLEELNLCNLYMDKENGKWIDNKNKGQANYFQSIDSAISHLETLKKLRINGDLKNGKFGISDISFLLKLNSLESLDLCYNEISDISCLEKLIKLQSLNLSYNKIFNVSFLQNLSKLQILDLGYNKITNTSFLKKLNGLQFLYLNSNRISNIAFLQNLTTMESLHLGLNQISDTSGLQNLTRLKSLDLDSNLISSISFLKNLTELKSLNLRKNKISDISFLQNLKSLQSLNLSSNQISNISFLQNLKSLQSLDISKNHISDISFLQNLTGLKKLDLRSNEISDISFLQNLVNLKTLYLSGNKISDISFLQNMEGLESLYLSENEISDISSIKNMKELLFLYLSENQISNISYLKNLTKLQSLYLYKNSTKSIDTETYKYKNYANIVKEYFARKAEKNKVKVKLPVKIILLGNHASGKSTFTNFFVHNQLKSEDSTHILRIVNYPTEQGNELPEAVIFDFGGQDYYHGLYRIYLSNQAINLIFWKEKHNHNAIVEQDSNGLSIYNFNLNYWLAQKAYFERNSQKPDPAFLIKTHTDESHQETIPQTSYTYEKHFDCCLTAKSEDHINRGFLKDTLKKEIENLRQQNATEEPQWYIDFLTFLYNHKPDNPFEPLTFEYILENHYERNTDTELDKIDFLNVNLRQLHNSGIILFYDTLQLQWSETSIPKIEYGLVWANPSALIEKLHQKVFNRDKLLKSKNPGVTTLEELGLNPESDAAILQLLKIQNVIFYHNKEKKYIIPNFLRLSSEFNGHYHDLKDVLDYQFTLQFKHFIPFGLINELMCYTGEQTEKFCRNGIIFTEQNVKISIELNMEKLQIEVAYLLKDPQQKQQLDRYLFFMILIFYCYHLPELPDYKIGKQDYLERFGNEKKEKGFSFFPTKKIQDFHRVLSNLRMVPDDLFISTDKQHFVKFQDLNIKGNEILTYNEAGNSLNKNISKAAFNSFIENPISDTKKIFVSYAREDAEYVEQLKKWFIPLLRKKHIQEVWTDNKILSGQNWEDEIEANLKSSDIVFLLISPDFYASNYIYEKELPLVKERYEADECTVIPILVRPSAHWSDDEWKNLRTIPTKNGNLTPISKWADNDDAWNAVIEAIKKIL